MCHKPIFGPPTAWAMAAIVIWAEYAWYKVVPFGETEANSSDRPIQSTSGSPWDLVMEMGVLDLTGLGVKEPLFRAVRPQTGHSGLDRRLVTCGLDRRLVTFGTARELVYACGCCQWTSH